MNYLSHFYFDTISEDSYYVMGIALPDLSKMANRTWNLHPHKHVEKFEDNPILKSIHSGWERHVQVDGLFHNSNYFKENADFIRDKIKKIHNIHPKIRPFVLGHIGLELLLDAVLLRKGIIDLKKYYTHLKKVDPTIINNFLRLNGINPENRFEMVLSRFIEVQYLASYNNNENLSYGLKRISERIWGIDIDPQHQKEFEYCLDKCYPIIEKNYFKIFDEIQSALKPF